MHEQRCGSTGVMQIIDKAAYYSIQTVRWCFDKVTGYGPNMTTEKWLTRVVFLETVAGVPGMVGAMIRHLHSLRLMRRDHGWIHTLLEEVRFTYHDRFSCVYRSYHSSEGHLTRTENGEDTRIQCVSYCCIVPVYVADPHCSLCAAM
jgi:hypothetical protein